MLPLLNSSRSLHFMLVTQNKRRVGENLKANDYQKPPIGFPWLTDLLHSLAQHPFCNEPARWLPFGTFTSSLKVDLSLGRIDSWCKMLDCGALLPWLHNPTLSLIPGGKKQKHSRACDSTLRMKNTDLQVEIIGYSGVSDLYPEFGKCTLTFSPPYLVGRFRFLSMLEVPFLLYLL